MSSEGKKPVDTSVAPSAPMMEVAVQPKGHPPPYEQYNRYPTVPPPPPKQIERQPYFGPLPPQPPAHSFSEALANAQARMPPPPINFPHIQTVVNTSSSATCRHCHAPLITRTRHVTTCRTHCCAFLLCMFFCWPCCLCPYCMESCQEPRIACASCGGHL